jgi:hypothetical protein
MFVDPGRTLPNLNLKTKAQARRARLTMINPIPGRRKRKVKRKALTRDEVVSLLLTDEMRWS